MNFLNYRKAIIFLLVLLLLSCVTPLTTSGNIEKTYTVRHPSNNSHQYGIINVQKFPLLSGHNPELCLSIPPSLINYYGNQTHSINDNSDYAQLVTPHTIAPIADCILKVTDKLPNPDEQFADAVLAFVHQIPYNVTDPQYPVETLAENMGDCVGLSLLAASVMESGGLDVVLILYTGINPQHMNVGVYLSHPPVYHTPLLAPTSFTYNNKTYWTAETTPEGNWRVGDQSQALSAAMASIIPLSSHLQTRPPAQVSARLNTNLVPSCIEVNLDDKLTSTDVNGERALNISGSIAPALPNQKINIYVSSDINDNSVLDFFTTMTDNYGNYNLIWNFTKAGTYYLTANWSGASIYEGSDTQTIPVFVGPQSYLQFDAADYNYIFGQPGLAAFATYPMQGVNDFVTLPLGTNAFLSYNFIVLQAGQTISNVPTVNVSVPASQERILLSRGKIATIVIPAHNQTVPKDVPNGLAPLMLPEDFNQTLDNQFSFVLQNSRGNYILNIKGLSQEDLSNMKPYSAITNVTGNIQEDIWYHLTMNTCNDLSTSSLSYENGTIIASSSSQHSGNQTVLLITNNEDTAIVLKDLTIQTQNPILQQTQSTQKPSHHANPTPALYVAILTLAVCITVTTIYVRSKMEKRKKPSFRHKNESRKKRMAFSKRFKVGFLLLMGFL